MINLELFKKVIPSSNDIKTLHYILDDFHRTKAFRLNYPQKQLIQHAHKQLGFGSLNLACGSCTARGMNKIISYCANFIDETSYTVTPKITTKKVKKKAKTTPKQIDIEDSIEELTTDQRKQIMREVCDDDFKLPTNYMALKKYAEDKLKKKYAKGTKKKTILKDLGV